MFLKYNYVIITQLCNDIKIDITTLRHAEEKNYDTIMVMGLFIDSSFVHVCSCVFAELRNVTSLLLQVASDGL